MMDERSNYTEVLTQVQDNHIGELMGRLMEAETKLNMAIVANKKQAELLQDYEATKEKLKEIRDKYHALETNVEGLKANLKEARAGRQAAQEQLVNCCGKPKKPTKKKVVKDGKHDTTQAK